MNWQKGLFVTGGMGILLLLSVVGYSLLRPTDIIPEKTKDLWFSDVTDEVGLDFVHDAGDLTKYLQPQIHGSGVAVFDFDGDGRPDLYFLTYGGPASKSINRLYKNMPDGTFKDVTEGSGLGIAGFNTGVIIGDVNNDGWPDVLITQMGGVKLFLNNGNGTFRDITEESGLKNPLWATSANFFDYDRDGWLDLVIVNYLEFDPTQPCQNPMGKKDYCGPRQSPSTVSKLFRNLGRKNQDPVDRVRFEDVTVSAGLATAPGPGLGVFCADFNGDGWPDIFIANDGKPNHLWINQKNGTFTQDALKSGIAIDAMGNAQAGMGVAVGDVENGGLFDVYVTHLAAERNTLWKQGPKRGNFRDQTARAGLLATEWRGTGFGTVMRDFDNDGWLDIAVVNGSVAQQTSATNPNLRDHLPYYAERNQIFRNDGKGIFRDISALNKPFCGTPDVTRGLASGILFNDCAMDLVVTTVAGRARVFRNVAPDRGHWLVVRALDPRLKRDAYGAEVRVRTGEQQMLRIVNPGDSFQSSSDPRAHFGLGKSLRYDAIRVLWPDGLSEVFPEGEADRSLVLRRGEGREEVPKEGK
jgi:hypothetical protein